MSDAQFYKDLHEMHTMSSERYAPYMSEHVLQHQISKAIYEQMQ